MMISGKGFYIWQGWVCEGGNPVAVADRCAADGIKHVFVKIADGVYPFNVVNGRDYAKEITAELQKKGIEVWGWQYVYGRNPTGEASIAVSRIAETGVTGFVINAEVEYKTSGAGAATTYLNILMPFCRGRNLLVGLSSYRYPVKYHLDFPWRPFVQQCNIMLPQVYWIGAHNPAEQLIASFQDYVELYRRLGLQPLPIVPTGAAFAEHGWTSTPADITQFMNQVQAMNLFAVSFWSYQHARTQVPELWGPIVNHPYLLPADIPPGDVEEPPVTEGEIIVTAYRLNMRLYYGTQFPVRGQAWQGDTYPVYERVRVSDQESWVKIPVWVAERYNGVNYADSIYSPEVQLSRVVPQAGPMSALTSRIRAAFSRPSEDDRVKAVVEAESGSVGRGGYSEQSGSDAADPAE